MLSRPENIPDIMNLFHLFYKEHMKKVDKKEETGLAILSIGPGWGKFGVMMREAIASCRAENGDLTPLMEDVIIDGIEVCDYFHKNLVKKKIYNNIFFGNILEKISVWNEKYHLVDLIDVLEHWPKPVGLDFLRKLLTTGKNVLLSVPRLTHMYKEEFYGKDCPKHETQYMEEDFNEFDSIELDSKKLPSINRLLVPRK